MTALDDRGLLEACHEGDLDACRSLTVRQAPSALRVAYLLTGNRGWAADLVCESMVDILRSLRRGRTIERLDHALLLEVTQRWLHHDRSSVAPTHDAAGEQSGAPESTVRRTQNALARLDDHQRAAVALHIYAGLPVEQLADALDLSSEFIYVQVVDSRARLIAAAEVDGSDALLSALNAVALNAPRLAVWSLIEARVYDAFEAERKRQRRLSIGVASTVCALLALGVAFVAWRGDEPNSAPASTVTAVADATSTTGVAFSVLPTPTPTPAADVGDAIVFSNRSAQAQQSWLFEERLEEFPLLGENTLEAGVPVVAPDGQQVFLLWYAYAEGGATGYVGAFDGDLRSELWRFAVATDDEVEPGGRVAFRMSVSVDHERVYVACHAWQASDLVEIDVLARDDGALLETIPTNLSGFAAHDIRLHSPPGSNQVNLFAITNEAPPETAGLQITYLAYAVPGGKKLHGRILFDLPDSRTFFLYESKLIAGSETLFGLEQTNFYHQLALHLFDLGRGKLDPRIVIPFQPVADPPPYQHAVSHDGHWLYVLSTASLEVAVFNLFDRSLAGIVPLDPGILSGQEIGVSYPQGRSMQISPDGRRVYAEGTLDGAASGIWVIDADSWTIVDHWLPELRPGEILLSGDGRTLYARIANTGGQLSPAGELIAIDTTTGEHQPLDIPDAERFSLESLATLFQRTYASSPAIDGQRPESHVSTAPLAAARVSVSQSDVIVGSTITIDVHFVHPLTGDAVVPRQEGARYQPPEGVRANWSLDDGDTALILELGRVGYGHYQGSVQLDQAGHWSLEVDLDWPEGELRDRSMVLNKAVKVVPIVSADGSPPVENPSG